MSYNADELNHSIPIAELVSYIEEARIDTEVPPTFKLAYLVNRRAGSRNI